VKFLVKNVKSTQKQKNCTSKLRLILGRDKRF